MTSHGRDRAARGRSYSSRSSPLLYGFHASLAVLFLLLRRGAPFSFPHPALDRRQWPSRGSPALCSSPRGRSAQNPSPTTELSTSIATTTIVTTVPVGLHTGSRSHTSTSAFTTTTTTTVPVTFSVTPTPSPTPKPVLLDTRADPAFGVLGALLILTCIPTAFLVHKNLTSTPVLPPRVSAIPGKKAAAPAL
ncbi:hypothetical protein AURDEDRAFT_178049 [Auricularia subglabra TFB-10046 SS5]|uniref:Uncharacterized protein n=1 Tax=Auricularia subglabra (strain TFB-10046 / SS5) TaxID=717982 RepID=J0L901_AURST|nr:hypothetical protein AURDEDRAFT_178049 [Auricularia subglabra TFB-10046 SS5]